MKDWNLFEKFIYCFGPFIVLLIVIGGPVFTGFAIIAAILGYLPVAFGLLIFALILTIIKLWTGAHL